MNRIETISGPEEDLAVNNRILQLEKENARLRDENEQLRSIFDTATDHFNRHEKRVEELERELDVEKGCRKELERENRRLKKALRAEKAKANKFADMLFGLKSEKLKLSDIEMRNGNTLVFEEESETEVPDGKAPAADSDDGSEGDAGESGSGAERRDSETSDGEQRTEGQDGETPDSEQEKEANDEQKKKKRGGQKGHAGNGRKLPDGLRTVETTVTLPEGENIHGIPAEDWIKQDGMEEVSYLIRKKVEWYAERIVRPKYVPPENSAPGVPPIITAPIRDKLIPQGKYGLEVWLDILINKFQQHIPVQRQVFAAQQAGANLLPGTVFGGLKTIYRTYLKPLYQQLLVELQNSERWHADETRWYMLCDAMKKMWYMWGFKSEDVTAFVLDPSRSATVPAKTLLGIDNLDQISEPVEIPEEKKKMLNVDRYCAYKALANLGLLALSFCWAHVRRDFTDIIKKYPDDRGLKEWAQGWLVKIAELYGINNERTKQPGQGEVFLEYDTRLRHALHNMKKEIDAELETDQNQVHEARFKAMESMNHHWSGLTAFVENPELPMDNNLIENDIRPCALGRKNYLGNHSEWGGELSACMYSIIQTCMQNRINPKAYLKHYFETAIKNNGQMSADMINSMLPGNLDQGVVKELDLGLKKP